MDFVTVVGITVTDSSILALNSFLFMDFPPQIFAFFSSFSYSVLQVLILIETIWWPYNIGQSVHILSSSLCIFFIFLLFFSYGPFITSGIWSLFLIRKMQNYDDLGLHRDFDLPSYAAVWPCTWSPTFRWYLPQPSLFCYTECCKNQVVLTIRGCKIQ